MDKVELSAGGFPFQVTATATVFSPTAVVALTFNATDQKQLTLPETGTYVIQVRASNLVSTGSYSFGLECLLPTSPVDATVVCGDPPLMRPISAPAQVDQIIFSGQANQRVTLTFGASGFPFQITATAMLFSPTAMAVRTFDANSQQQLTLTESGTYVIQVRASDLVSTGSYSIGLIAIPCQPPPPSISLTPNPLTITASGSGSLTVTISHAQSTDTTVTLSSSNPEVAKVDPSVTILANTTSKPSTVMGLKAGSATITATLPASLGGGSATASVTVNNPAPTLSSLSPSSATAGGSAITLTVNGTNFVSDSKVQWNGSERTTNFVSATQLTATIPATDIVMDGMVSITVFNPAPGGGISNALSFTITSPVRVVRVVDASGNPGGRVTVPIQLVSQGDENALGFSLTFDPAILSNPMVMLGGDAVGASINLNTSQAAQSRLGVVLALPANQKFAAGVREIVKVTFGVNANAMAASTPVGFGDQPIPREVVGVNANTLLATYTPGTVTLCGGFEADVAPRPNGNGDVTVADWVQVGRFAARLDTAVEGCEFQRADCAPKETKGDGQINVADWVQAGRYAAGLDPVMSVGGPASPAPPTMMALASRAAANTRAEVSEIRTVRIASTVAHVEGRAVSIELDAQGDENALGFTLRFDPQRWRFISAVAGDGAVGAILQINASEATDGRVGFALALPAGQTWATGGQQLVVATFAPISLDEAEVSAIRFGDYPIVRELVNANADALPASYVSDLGSVAPELFTITAGGHDVAAGYVLRVKPDGSQSNEPIARFDTSQNKYVPLPIDLGPATDQVFLILFGAGIRFRSSLAATTARIGGETAEVLYAGAQGGFVGLDQINLNLSRSLAGRGEVDIVLTADGRRANAVRVSIK